MNLRVIQTVLLLCSLTHFGIPLSVDEDTTTEEYDGLELQVLTKENEVELMVVAELALVSYDWHGLTRSNIFDGLVTVALNKEMGEKFNISLQTREIQPQSLQKVDKFAISADTLSFGDDMYLRNNMDPDKYDFGMIWDIDTIYNYINHTTSQVPWMEELTFSLGEGVKPLKIIKVSRYPESSYKDQRVHVFMSSWDSSQWVSIKAALHMLDRILLYEEDIYGHIHPLVTRNTLYIIPLPNPQGYTQTVTKNRFWNKNLNAISEGDFNCIGVDLELNARASVKSKLSDKVCNTKFDGPLPFSEIEVSTILDFAVDVTANTNKPIFWFQFDEHYYSVLVSPYFGDLVSSPPNFTDILGFYKEEKEKIVSDITYKKPYDLRLGVDVLYPLPEGFFLSKLLGLGISSTFLVGMPLHLSDMLKPVGSVGQTLPQAFVLSLFDAVDELTTITSPVVTYSPIIGIVAMAVSLILLIGSILFVFALHEDTKRLEHERAAVFEDVPQHVRAVGAIRQYDTEVIAGNTVNRRTVGPIMEDDGLL